MTTRAILPIKSFTAAKQRLAHELSRSKAVDEIVVVSSDHGAQQIAGGHGANVLEDAQSGHSDAAAMAIREAVEAGVTRVLLVPGDCPLLDPKEVDQLLSRPESERMAVIVPDRHGTGTNALVLSPPDVLAPSFGPDSRARHGTMARDAGVPHAVVEVPTLSLDIDTPDDLDALRVRLEGLHGGAAHTRGMLNQLTRSRL
jgi:2-phospho-L-lactate guanylyltransferase